eukprot:MONOS_16288.1-p1 / transcript=MONOS_16288.1 / gene=MONOS_16288 / organism=Monocercomonoides_exilis_PA203 / gene_product=unspecified product / transcript_product=unspecified product / location=Mono_scaffold01617:3775-5014(-) / protein_length=360 / sequence_SO=supercontig / SO=protein_coding / is_pseudo=false
MLEEEVRKEKKNEMLLVRLCECNLTLFEENYKIPDDLITFYVSKLLAISSKIDADEMTQKEVEMSLVALSNIYAWSEIETELYSEKITDIIKRHQQHGNLTRLAYQSAWKFVFRRIMSNKGFVIETAKELHFLREMAGELEELGKCVDWKGKEEDRRGKEAKNFNTILRWLNVFGVYLWYFKEFEKEFEGIIRCVIRMGKEAKENHTEIWEECFYLLERMVVVRNVNIDAFLRRNSCEGEREREEEEREVGKRGKRGKRERGEERCAFDAISEEIIQPTMNFNVISSCFCFLQSVWIRLNRKCREKSEEEKRKKRKREIFDRLEADGHEDCVVSCCPLVKNNTLNVKPNNRFVNCFAYK